MRKDKTLPDRLAGYLRKRKLPNWLLRCLEPEIRDAEEGGSAEFKELCRRATAELYFRRLRRRGSPEGESASHIEIAPLLDRRERRRAEVVSEEFARLALRFGGSQDPSGQDPRNSRVLEFRAAFLDGAVVDEGTARNICHSLAVRSVDESVFRTGAVPIASHQSARTSMTRRIDPITNAATTKEVYELIWPGGRRVASVEYDSETSHVDFAYPSEDGELIDAHVLPGSVLGRLAFLADRLSRAYDWPSWEAAWFVLTGKAPSVTLFKAQGHVAIRIDHSHGDIQLTFPPWLSAKSAMRVYRHVQRRMLGKANRLSRVATLQFMDFVSKRRHEGQAWPDILSEWNRRFPKRRYSRRQEVNFQRDFERIYDIVIHPKFETQTRRERAIVPTRKLEDGNDER